MPAMDNPGHSPAILAGFLLLDKPVGFSSMKAVSAVRRKAGGAKTGHAGTLDPLATGLLVIAIGKATRSLDNLTGLDKRYHTRVDLSAFTTTDDREGDREAVTVVQPPSLHDIERAVRHATGEVLQTPPAFSAIKIGGKRAYKLARQGAPPEMPPRHVTLYSALVTSFDWPFVDVELHTSSGYYVRSFARGLGQALGTGGHCASIRRTAVGPFAIEDAVTLEALAELLTPGDLLGIDEALAKTGTGEQSRSRTARSPADSRGT